MSEDRRTKADLLSELGYARLAASKAQELREQDAKKHADEKAARDKETAAIEGCIRWLATIEPTQPRNGSGNYSVYSNAPGPRLSESPSLERALSYLRQRFGIPDPTAQIDDLMERLTQAENRASAAEYQLGNIRASVGMQS